ncbi:endo alpha-1,4 polygalactosaminidase [Streptomyces sp. NPDC048001]|uniref:endo alpha-1,4 polygalactosaminidase n=1 Tax=unclassified Streptomyces TaxID=2593676 RepID=UPI003716BE02
MRAPGAGGPHPSGRPAAGRAARAAAAAATAVLLLFTAACSGGGEREPHPSAPGPGASEAVRPPEPGTVFDYQIGGPYAPPGAVRAVARDRSAEPAPGLYNVCYVNAFQAQPGDEVDWWRTHHPRLLLRDGRGALVVDEDWEEPLLDISTEARRSALMEVIGPWIDGCAEDGYDAVEPDNLDSYTRSDGLLTADHAVAFARLLSERAHARGLAIAQKNGAELLGARDRMGFDFAVAEECGRYDECTAYQEAYEGRVFDVEYRAPDFATACRNRGGAPLSVTLRDREVRPAGSPGHVHRTC